MGRRFLWGVGFAGREADAEFECGGAGDAAWQMGLERDADLIPIQCYAPLFVNVNPGASEWNTNLIGYDAMTSFGSPSYYQGEDVPGRTREIGCCRCNWRFRPEGDDELHSGGGARGDRGWGRGTQDVEYKGDQRDGDGWEGSAAAGFDDGYRAGGGSRETSGICRTRR